MSQTDEKQRLRAAMRARREALDPAARAAGARSACARAVALPEFERARTVAGFVAVRAEMDPAEALAAAWDGRKTVVLPRVTKDQKPRLRFHRVDRSAALRDAAFGLHEPEASWPEVAVEDVDLFLVPGMAFDARGGRLGWGGGYYDEALRSPPRGGAAVSGPAGARGPFLVGLGYDFQVVDSVPNGLEDVAIDCVVTDVRTIRREVSP